MPPKKHPDQTQDVPMDQIKEPTFDVRLRHDPSSLRALADDINDNELQSPIVLRQGEPPYEIVYGHRRFLAFRLLQRTKIPAFIRQFTDEQAILIRAGENIHRDDLSIIEEGRIYTYLRDTFKLSLNAIARKMNRSAPHVAACVDALTLPEFVQEALQVKSVPFAAIKWLMKIEEEQWRVFYMRAAVDHGASVEIAKRWLEEWRRGAEKRQIEQEIAPPQQPIQERVILTECQVCHDAVELEKARAIHTCVHCYNYLIHDIPHPKKVAQDEQQTQH